ncbi:MAG: hypothetical protein KJO98_15260 [Rhodothermia bacterium]|nr:hypothetical protein [Rhodothermia bacterium]
MAQTPRIPTSRLRRTAFLLGAIIFLITGCDQSPESLDESTWETIQAKVLEPNCTGCHAAGTDFARQSDLVLTADVAYDQLVDVPPRNAAAKADGLVRISSEGLAGLDKSFLWEKINAREREHFLSDHPEYGSFMPLGAPPLANGEIELIRRWIVAGAPRDVQVTDPEPLLADKTRFEEAQEFIPLSAPSKGLAIRLGPFEVAPNFEREFFYYEPASGTQGLLVERVEISMRPGSHHFILYTHADDMPTALQPSAHDYRDIRTPGGALDFDVIRVMEHHIFFAGTQWPSMDYRFPPGVALRLPAGKGLDLNSHYVNRSNDPITGEVHVNLHTVDPGEAQRVAEVLFLNNLNISLPPQQTTTLTRTYRFTDRREVFMLFSHAHQHMQEFRVYVDGGTRSGELVYIAYDWEHPPIAEIDPPLVLEPGEGLRLEATYNNWTDRTLTFGLRSEDEMMILFGYYLSG